MLLLFAPMSRAGEPTPAGQECFDEAYYLENNPDVAAAVANHTMPSGKVHFDVFGKKEGRRSCPPSPHVRIPLAGRIVLLAAALAAVLWLSRRKRIGITATAVGLAVPIALFACFDYVVGNKVFVFADIASDTRNQFWPTMTYLARHIRRGELPMWNFGIGLGQNMFPDWLTDPFAVIAILTGEWTLPYALGPLHVLKVAVAAFFLARYFQLLGYSRTACIVGALAIALCGHMMARGTWYEYATEVAAVAFYLYAMERFVQTGRFGLLALATCLIGCPGTFYAYHYFILLTSFALVRIFWFGDRLFTRPRQVLARWLAASAIGVAMVAVFLLPDLLNTLRSTRVTGQGEVLSGHARTSLLQRESGDVLLTAIARQLSSNLLGNAGTYTGSKNYLEAPLAYVGILPLLCVPICWALSGKRQRLMLAVFLVLAFAYHDLVYFRLLVDAFAGPIFKISNLWITVGLGLCAAKAVDLVERRQQVRHLAVGVALAAVLGMLALVYLVAPRYGMTISLGMLWLAAGTAVACTAALLLWGWRGLGDRSAQVLLALVAVELAACSYQSLVPNRRAFDGESPRQHAGYEDAGFRTIRTIREGDPSTYRIERERNSVFLMDALMQDYWGTKAYMSFGSPSYAEFLWALGILDKDYAAPSYIDGLGQRGSLLPLLGVKYYVSSSGAAPMGYEKQGQNPDFAVFANPRATFGVVYGQSILRSEFKQLQGTALKEAALLRAAVVESPPAAVRTLSAEELRLQAAADLSGCTGEERCLIPSRVRDELAGLEATRVRFTHFDNDGIRGSVSISAPGFLYLAVPFDHGWRLSLDGRPQQLQRVNIGFMGVELSAGDHEFAMEYRTPGLLPGVCLSLAGVCVLAAAALVPAWRRRRASRPEFA